MIKNMLISFSGMAKSDSSISKLLPVLQRLHSSRLKILVMPKMLFVAEMDMSMTVEDFELNFRRGNAEVIFIHLPNLFC